MTLTSKLGILLVSVSLCNCAARVTRTKDITYQPASGKAGAMGLSVFSPREVKPDRNVLLFIHGGNWNKGHRGTYNFWGKRWARKGVVAVVIDYPLSPSATADQMAKSSAQALLWTKENISKYGGDPDRIFVSGHSAGGQLAAIVSVRDEYFTKLGKPNPIKGTILIDAAGLDMYGYLKKANLAQNHTYFTTFTHEPEKWKGASALYYVRKDMPPLLIYRGGKTYKMIAESNDLFLESLKSVNAKYDYHFQKGKHHIPMIAQFIRSGNKRYDEIIQFMNENGHTK